MKGIGFYRENTERLAEENGIDLNISLNHAISIKDRMKKHKVYNNVTQLLTNRNFQHNQIAISQDVRVRVNQES